jgi:hypothetical protein
VTRACSRASGLASYELDRTDSALASAAAAAGSAASAAAAARAQVSGWAGHEMCVAGWLAGWQLALRVPGDAT